MAKSKDENTKIKVPKRVAGVKIPKTVRKGPVVDFINSSTGRMLIAKGLTDAVALLAHMNAESPGTRSIKDTVVDAEDRHERETARLAFAFGEAVRAFREALAQPASELEIDDSRDDARDEPLPPPASRTKSRLATRSEPARADNGR